MFTTFDEKILANYLTTIIRRNGLNCEIVAQKCNTSAATVRNLCSGKTANPGILTALPIIYAAGGSPEEMMLGENKDSAKEFSINSVKEIYEQQLVEKDKMHEKHVDDIRSHYEHHLQDNTNHYENRLADKDEHNKSLKREIRSYKIWAAISITILVALLIAEVMNPNLGWLRY